MFFSSDDEQKPTKTPAPKKIHASKDELSGAFFEDDDDDSSSSSSSDDSNTARPPPKKKPQQPIPTKKTAAPKAPPKIEINAKDLNPNMTKE